jgi:hypothetical protein
MPGSFDLVGLLVVIVILWIVLKVAKVAIRLIFLFMTVVLIAAAVYWFFLR